MVPKVGMLWPRWYASTVAPMARIPFWPRSYDHTILYTRARSYDRATDTLATLAAAIEHQDVGR